MNVYKHIIKETTDTSFHSQFKAPGHKHPSDTPQCSRDILGFLSVVRTKQLQYPLQALPGMAPSATALVMVQSFLQLVEEVAASSRHLLSTVVGIP